MEIEKEYKTLPTLKNKSEILKEEHLRKVFSSNTWSFLLSNSNMLVFVLKIKLNVNLIPRAMGYSWTQAFSTEQHGFSLNHLYRTLADVEGPCLVVVQDTCRNVIIKWTIFFSKKTFMININVIGIWCYDFIKAVSVWALLRHRWIIFVYILSKL